MGVSDILRLDAWWAFMVLVGQFSGRQRSNKEAARGMADLGSGLGGVGCGVQSLPRHKLILSA